MQIKLDLQRGVSIVNLLIGVSLLSIAIGGAIKLLGSSLSAQNTQGTNNLVDQVSRITEIVSIHLNRGGSFKNPDVEAKGIQICSLEDEASICNQYQSTATNFCLSIPTRVSKGGQDVINITGFRLFNGVLAQREINAVNMGSFDHKQFCNTQMDWLDLNNSDDFKFTSIRFCRFSAASAQQVTDNYDANCQSIIQGQPLASVFWVGIFKAKVDGSIRNGQYEEARIIQLLNSTRVRVGS